MHARLTAFWTRARQWYEIYFLEQGYSEEQIKQFLGLVSFDIAPEHLRAIEEQKKTILAGPKPKPKPKKLKPKPMRLTKRGMTTKMRRTAIAAPRRVM